MHSKVKNYIFYTCYIFALLQVIVGDFNGDKKADILCRKTNGEGREVALSDGVGFRVWDS